MQSYPSPNAMAADNGGGPFYQTPSSTQPPPLSNSEELQLTAQLTRGLAPARNNTGAAGNIIGGQEQAASRNMNHQYENAGPHAIELRSPNDSMDQMNMQFSTPDRPADLSKQRTKVSRACDECRRKKIKCDAQGEGPNDVCSNCVRVKTTCLFTRLPMKRGPSKGYIKELADRVQHLEGFVQAGDPGAQYIHQQQHEGPPQPPRRGSAEFSPPPHTDPTGRKRTFSNASGDYASAYPQQSSRPQGWASQESPRHAPPPSFSTPQSAPTAQMFPNPTYTENGLQPVPQWRPAPEPPRNQITLPLGLDDPDYVAEWDDKIMESYYSLIHPTYPLLPASRTNLRDQLANSSALVREAFHTAVYAAVRSFPTALASTLKERSTKKASMAIATSLLESPSLRSFPRANTIYLQIILLMSIEAGNRGPATGGASASQSAWLGYGLTLAHQMKLHVYKATAEGDHDSEEKIARRLWWSLIIMDRFHASSFATPLMVAESNVALYPGDEYVLGPMMYQLARLSIVLGHFSAIDLIPTDVPQLFFPPISILHVLMRGELERCRESFGPTVIGSTNVIHVTYWILSIQLLVCLPESEPSEFLAPVLNIVTHLAQPDTHLTPLAHYAVALAASTLVELAKYSSTRDQAEKGLKLLLEGRSYSSAWDAAVRDMVAKKQRGVLAAQGLQHLANIATAAPAPPGGESEKTGPEQASSPEQPLKGLRDAFKAGYLNSLAD